jgi:two-component system nitrogen regulation response regulator NtrX
MTKEKILIIDDETGIRSSLQGILEDEGYVVKTASSGEEGLVLLKDEYFGLVLLDVWLPEMGGIQVLEEVNTFEESPQIVMISGHGSVESAVKATKLGAYDFLEKPLSLDKVVLTVKNALKQKRLEEENIQLRERFRANTSLVGGSPPIQKVRKAIKAAASSSGRVLISGEPGSGKELAARLIHLSSPRKNHRFVQINVGAVPENLMERELYGFVEGTFSDYEKAKKGKLSLADGGVLFLGEIGEMALETQAKLVQVLDENRFEPLGSTTSSKINTRIIAATNIDLKKMIADGQFLEELYYKINVIPISVPPLRDRKEDIPDLINHYLQIFALRDGKKEKSISEEALQGFVNYSWPGNVSELINVIERFVIMVPDLTIQASHLYLLVEPMEAELLPEKPKKRSLEKATELFEKEYIHQTLLNHNWSLGETAKELEITEAKLETIIKSHGISFFG